MLKKMMLILTVLLVALLAISAVSAAENVTENNVLDDIKDNEVVASFEDFTDGSEVFSSAKNNENISSNVAEDVLGLPRYDDYEVSVSDVSISYGSSGSIRMSISPAYGFDHKYNFYLKVLDSNNVEVINQHFYSTKSSTYETYNLNSCSLEPGTYTIKIMNTPDRHIMDSATLTVTSVPYSAYSVKVSNYSMSYGSSGSIKMSISPASRYTYKYDFYFKVYDFEGGEVISERYYSTSSSYSKIYSVAANSLAPGIYTVKIVNTQDKKVMSSSKLYVKSVSYSDYSVNVSDTTVKYSSVGFISMAISPALGNSKYKYDFYLKVYDSNNFEKISQRYYSSNSASSLETYEIPASGLDYGVYTIKILNSEDNHVMSSANLFVVSVPYSEYSVSVSNITRVATSSSSIVMSITPASKANKYKYDFYLKVYDSNNNEVVNQRYYSTSSATSKTYTINANSLNPGLYTIKILNYGDNHLMATSRLSVVNVPYGAYSVSVADTSITYGIGGSIVMAVSPSSSSYNYKYDFYLKVYDSNGNQKISKRYYSTSSSTSISYGLTSTALDPGVYTVKILNNIDNHLMGSAKLTVKNIGLETSDAVGNCNQVILYKVRASENGTYKSSLKVTFYCNGEEYPVTTDSNGYATLKVHLKVGTYQITTDCEGVKKENTIKVNQVYVADQYKGAYVKSLTGYYNGKNIIKYGWKGNLEGYFRIYKGNKVIYQSKFNSNGYIDDYFKYTAHNNRHSLSKMGVGAYRAVITDKNGKAIAKGTIKIVKSPTHIKCGSSVIKVGTKKSIKVYVYDKSNSRKNVAGAVKVTINGKTYGAKVNNGAAVIKNVRFPSKVKTYVGNVKFIENKNYKESSVKFKVSVRKLASEIDVSSMSVSPGAKTSIVAKVYVIDLSGDYIKPKSGTVKFTVYGETYYAKVNNGVAKLRLTAPYSTGTYSCKAVYLGGNSIKQSSTSFKISVKKPSYSVTFDLNVNSGWYSEAKLKTGDVLLGVANSYNRQHLKGITIGTRIDAGQEFQHSTRLIKATVWYENDYTGRIITRTNPSVYNGYNIKVFDWIDGYTPYQAQIWYTYR